MRTTLSALLAAFLMIACASDAAWGQSRRPGRPSREPSQPTQPAPKPADPGDVDDPDPEDSQTQQPVLPRGPAPSVAPAAPEQRDPPKDSPYLQRERPKDWTIKVDVTVQSYQDFRPGQRQMPVIAPLVFDQAMVVFPVVPTTGSSLVLTERIEDAAVPVVRGYVDLDGRTVSDTPELISTRAGGEPLQGGSWRAQWPVLPLQGGGKYEVRNMKLHVEIPVQAFRTVFDEQGARNIVWPKNGWPEEVQTVFEPYGFVDNDLRNDYDMSTIDGLIAQWTDGQDPKKVKPSVLAKWLCGNVADHVTQLTGNGFSYDTRTGVINGFEPQPVGETASSQRGSPIDLATLLCAVYRRAGLPARLVVGYDEDGDRNKTYLERNSKSRELRVWVEFALYDDVENTLAWVPVDIAQIKKSSSRMPPNFMDRDLKYFGTHDELDRVVPLSFHLHPPTSVIAHGAPGLWGWLPQSRDGRVQVVGATQFLRFDVGRTPSRGR